MDKLNKKIIKNIALPFLCFPLLFSCGNNIDSVSKVNIDMGTLIGMDDEIKNDSHMIKISYDEVNTLVSEKKNFILLVHSTVNFCSCYAEWHDNILSPYIKKHNLLVYFLDYQDISKKEEQFGLKLFSNHETLGIFENGTLKYQNDNVEQNKPWVTSKESFEAWMDARISYPRMLKIDKTILDSLYEKKLTGVLEFTIYFGLGGCPDCSYLEETSITSYFRANDNTSPLFYIDTGVLGIRKVADENGKEYGPSVNPNGSKIEQEYQKQAKDQWEKFKLDYGLSESSSNPMGYGTGYIPTIFHINPDGISKNGNVIDAGGVFYNDTFDASTSTITASYFNKERVKLDQFEYLKDVDVKVLEGLKVDYQRKENQSERNFYHESNRSYVEPIVYSLLDWCIKN